MGTVNGRLSDVYKVLFHSIIFPSPLTNQPSASLTHTYIPDLHQSPATFHTMKFSAIAAAAIGALAVQASPIKRAATITDTDILQYALTLEHLEK
jgi:hypothetical protein